MRELEPERRLCLFYERDDRATFRYVKLENKQKVKINHLVQPYCMLFVLHGSVELLCKNRVARINRGLTSGEFVLFATEELIQVEAAISSQIVLYMCDLDQVECAKYIRASLSRTREGMPVRLGALKMNVYIRNYLALLKVFLEEGRHCGKLYRMKESELFTLLCAFYSHDELADLFYCAMIPVIPFKDKVLIHYSVGVKNAKEFAEQCGYSEREFNQLFRQFFGETPYQWMLREKSHQVKKRLAQPKVDIKSIVEECQFSSSSHFIHFCKKYLGDTPSRLRREMAEVDEAYR